MLAASLYTGITTAISGGENCGDIFIPPSGKQVLGLACGFPRNGEARIGVRFKFCSYRPNRLKRRSTHAVFDVCFRTISSQDRQFPAREYFSYRHFPPPDPAPPFTGRI